MNTRKGGAMRAVVRLGLSGLGTLTAVVALVATASAGETVGVPEIDITAIPAALGLAAAGVMILRARRGSR
jgi:hypothetical protein